MIFVRSGRFFVLILVFSLFAVLVFANHSLTLVSPTTTVQNITNQSTTFVYINITSNSTIANNGSTYFSWYNQSGENVNFSVNGTGGIVLNATGANGGASVPNYTSRNFTNLVNGTHRFLIYVYSNETNDTSAISINVTIDDTAPTATINKIRDNTPANATNVTVLNPTIEFTITDNINYSSFGYKVFVDSVVDQTGTATNNTPTNVTLSSLSEGTHRVAVEVNDSAFNVRNSTLITFTVDAIPILQFINRTPTTTVVSVGNTSATYALRANVTVNNAGATGGNASGVSVTFIMPYGMVNLTACNAVAFSRLNTTHVSCSRNVGNIANSTSTVVELNVTANISAYTQYGVQIFSFAANCTDGFPNNGCAQNTTFALISAVNSIRNPRPDAVDTSTSNATLVFTFWNQSDNGYKVMTPIYTFNPTLGRPELANNSYGEILYFDKSLFEAPSFMKLWSYNLTFRITFMGATGAANFTIRSPINNSLYPIQSLTPLFIQTSEIQDFITNVTRNFTLGIPNPNSFTVFWNGTSYIQSALLLSRGLNVTFTGAVPGFDQSTTLLSVSIQNETIANMTNNTDISVLFTLTNITACGTVPCTTSPIFVNSQSISGWSHETPPKFGSSINISYLINVTNLFTNYTLNNLSISIMQPMNVTMVGAATQQFNMTKLSSVKISVWNGSVFVENLSVIRRESNFSFNDASGPSKSNVTIYITTFDAVLSSNDHINGSKGWEPNSNGIVIINFTAEMTFPVLNETAPPSGSAGTNEYNVTTNQPQRAPLNLTSKVTGLDSSATGVNVTIDGVQVASANLTIGSLVLKDVTSGQHVITVKYTVPAAAAASTTTTTTTSSGGQATKKDIASTDANPGVVSKLKYDEKDIGIKEIHIEVNNKANNVRITITKLAGQPASVTRTITGKVFQYLQIDTENLASDNIKTAIMQFNVTKAWLTINNASAEDVTLNRYVNTSGWRRLKTTKLSESPTDVMFEAETPGFSIFAVTAEKIITATPVPTPVPAPSNVTRPTPTPAVPVAPKTPPYLIVALVIVLLAAIAYFKFIAKANEL